ncbi:MAG: hypothetical protein H7A51_16100 [Akkermansiaceae bacterium]|nr:hypothetical protein [Akkermansiaceae bacterium]
MNNDEILAACIKLKASVKAAPIEHLRKPIEEESELDLTRSLQSAREWVEDLMLCAGLGYEKAVKELAFLGNQIAMFLAQEAVSAQQHNGHPPAESVTTDSPQANSWREELEDAVSALATVPVNTIKQAIGPAFGELPPSKFSFPFRILVENDGRPPTDRVRLITEIADSLIQQKLTNRIAPKVKKFINYSWYWPISASATDYQRNRKLQEIMPPINLGGSIAACLSKSPRGNTTPLPICLEIFRILEHERTKPRSQKHLEELRDGDAKEDPYPISKLIDLAEHPKYAAPRLTPAAPWNLENIWIRKAALLEPLTESNMVLWVEAAFCLVASKCEGKFANYKWPEGISKRIASAESARAGVKKFLQEGFETLVNH